MANLASAFPLDLPDCYIRTKSIGPDCGGWWLNLRLKRQMSGPESCCFAPIRAISNLVRVSMVTHLLTTSDGPSRFSQTDIQFFYPLFIIISNPQHTHHNTHTVPIPISLAELVSIMQFNWTKSLNTDIIWIKQIGFPVYFLWSLAISRFCITRLDWTTGYLWKRMLPA